MAQRTVITKIDDLDDTVVADESTGIVVETIPFALDGVAYEIDLGPDNAGKLRSELRQFAEAARKITGIGAKRAANRTRASSAGTVSDAGSRYTPVQRKEIRDWCLSHGAKMGERGRIPEWAYAAWETKDTDKLVKSEVLASV